METDGVRAMASQLKQAAEAMRLQTQSLNGSAQSVDWFGPSRDEFVMETEGIVRQLESQVDLGVVLAGRVDSEVAEWENAANSFGTGESSVQSFFKHIGEILLTPFLILQELFKPRQDYETRPCTDTPPGNMQELAKMVTDLYDTGTPIRVIKTGENEYLILVTGTEAGKQAHNWNSAARSGLGLESDYEKQLKGILLGLPAGAIINLAGHSQGGIVSNNVVADKDVQDHLKIKSVTTFGSPVSAEPQGNIGPDGKPVEYKRYAAWGDPVPLLSNEALDVVGAIGKTPFDFWKIGKETGDLGQHMISGSFNVKDAHFAYNSSDELKNETLPFDVKQWANSDYYYSKCSSGELAFDKKLF
jgi:hypothetical protein